VKAGRACAARLTVALTGASSAWPADNVQRFRTWIDNGFAPLGAMARRRPGGSPPAAPGRAADEPSRAPRAVSGRPPDALARRLVGTAHRPRAGGVVPHACPRPGQTHTGERQSCRSAGRCGRERRRPLKAPTNTGVERPSSASRRLAGAVTSSPLSWLMAAVRALTAPLRAVRSARIDSTIPSRRLGAAVAVPASTARAAASASIGPDLPRWRRVRRSGRSTSTTVTRRVRKLCHGL
jgi:hypothetical protein